MTKQAREDIAAVALIMMTIAVIGLATLYIIRDVSKTRRIIRWERAAVDRADFDTWEKE